MEDIADGRQQAFHSLEELGALLAGTAVSDKNTALTNVKHKFDQVEEIMFKLLHIRMIRFIARAVASLVLLALAGCSNGGGGDSPPPPAPLYTVGGTVSGLAGSGLVLRNNGGDDFAVSADSSFSFTTTLANGGSYEVTVLTQPTNPAQTCAVSSGSGTVTGANVTNVAVVCVTNTYTIGGTVSGLSGTLVLRNNGSDLTLSANAGFTFAAPVASGNSYNVTVLTQPSGQQCSIVGGQGAVGNANITSVSVACFASLVLDVQPLSKVVGLSWNHIGATSYNLYYSTAPNCDITNIASCPGGTLQQNVSSPHDVTGLTNAQPYYFYLAANHLSGHRTTSNEASARPDVLATNGRVSALAVDAGGTVYLGGSFTRIGARTGHGVSLDAGNLGRLRGVSSMVNGTVHAIVTDSTGGWYIGGAFTQAGGVVRNNLAHVLADGTVDPAWNPNANNTVRALAVSGGTVYAGGDFTMIGGITRNRLAAISTSGTLQAWNPNANGTILALAVNGGTVYAGGSFNTIGGIARNFLAALGTNADGSASLLPWNPNPNSLVTALAVSGGTVYAGGFFTTIGGVARNFLAALGTNADGSASLLPWNPNPNSLVTALAVSGGTVYAGGDFTTIGGVARNFLAALGTNADGSASLLAWNPNADGAVRALAVGGSTVYAGGDFTTIGGVGRGRLAAIGADGTLQTWNPNANDTVETLAVNGSTVYAGGWFTTIGSITRNRLAAIGTSGTLQAWNPNASGAVETLAVSGGTVYVGGGFFTIGGIARNRLAALGTNADGSASLLPWNPNPNTTGGVTALAVSGGTVYAGGDFTTIGGIARNRLAALGTNADGSASLLAWNPNADGAVRALAVSGSTVYAGGLFTTIGGIVRNRLVALGTNADGSASLLAWNPNVGSTISVVSALAISGGTVYAGGLFNTIGGVVRNFLAALGTNADGSASLLAWNPNPNSIIDALAVSGGTVYAGGSFTTIGGEMAGGFAALAP